MSNKCQIEGTAKIRLYEVIQRAVSDGIEYGWNRAHKYNDKPPQHILKSEVYGSVMSSICEVIDFE